MTEPARAPGLPNPTASMLERALDTERAYFELGAQVEPLPGAVLAWTPDFVRSPAASVVQRVDPREIESFPDWLRGVERELAERQVPLARIYLTRREEGIEQALSAGGYTQRKELLFAHQLPDPDPGLTFRQVLSDEDWARKRRFHEGSDESPDGHPTSGADLVGLERRKCAHGMDCFLGEAGGEILGVIGAVWGSGVVRIKNLIVHPDHRKQSVATRLLSHVAALGRQRGIGEQCLVALEGGAGERLYRSLGMRLLGSQTEWSRDLRATAS